jgi:hypothetical protein
MHDTKIGVVICDSLLNWQQLNVTAFLASGIATSAPESTGESYEDATGAHYLSLFGQPVFVYIASSENLQRTRARAANRNVPIAIYTASMFGTGNDLANRAVVKLHSSEQLELVGLALRTEGKTFDKIVNGLKLHP